MVSGVGPERDISVSNPTNQGVCRPGLFPARMTRAVPVSSRFLQRC